MKVYLIRHADAEPLDLDGSTDDAQRRLTAHGQAQAKRLGLELPRRGVFPTLVLTSPSLRAKQTAETMLSVWPEPLPPLRECAPLAMDGRKRDLALEINALRPESVALVGHQPDLQRLAGWIVGETEIKLDFEKGGVAYFTCGSEFRAGCGTLIWLVTPEWLVSADQAG